MPNALPSDNAPGSPMPQQFQDICGPNNVRILDRKLLRMGKLWKISRKGDLQDRFFVLFSDMLVVASPSTSSTSNFSGTSQNLKLPGSPFGIQGNQKRRLTDWKGEKDFEALSGPLTIHNIIMIKDLKVKSVLDPNENSGERAYDLSTFPFEAPSACFKTEENTKTIKPLPKHTAYHGNPLYQPVTQNSGNGTPMANAFIVLSASKSFQLVCNTLQEKLDWVSAIDQARLDAKIYERQKRERELNLQSMKTQLENSKSEPTSSGSNFFKGMISLVSDALAKPVVDSASSKRNSVDSSFADDGDQCTAPGNQYVIRLLIFY